MAMVFTNTLMELATWAFGKTMSNTEGARKPGQMARTLKETMLKERNMVREPIIGPTALASVGDGAITKSTASVFTNGQMADGLKAIDATNPRILLTLFMKNVYPTFRDPVLSKNEEVLIKLVQDVLQNKFSEMSFAFWIFDKHWKTMSEPDKDKIWKWCTALVLLSERAAASS